MPIISWRDLLLPASPKTISGKSQGGVTDAGRAPDKQNTHSAIIKTHLGAKRISKFLLWCSGGALLVGAINWLRRP